MESTSFEESPDPIASCPLDVPENKNRMLYLFPDRLVIQSKSRTRSFYLRDIQSIGIQKKIILFYAVVGGIMTPLSLLAAFNDAGHPLLMIFLSFTGIMGLYFGLAGQEGISLESKFNHVHFFIYSPHPMLSSFIRLTRNFIKHKNLDQFFRITFTQEEYQELLREKSLRFPKGKRLKFAENELEEQERIRTAFLNNPYENKMKIEYLFNDSNEVYPYLYGKIDLDNVRFLNDG